MSNDQLHPVQTPDTETGTDLRLLLLSDKDNVLVACRQIEAQESVAIEGQPVVMTTTLLLGHKVARKTIEPAEKIMKYGAPIGSATQQIAVGEHVHVHNMKSDYTRTHTIDKSAERAAQ